MPYSIFSVVALSIHILINVEMFTKKDTVPYIKQYRMFLLSIAAFYITDIFWGIFDYFKIYSALYTDTIFYFLTMGLTIFLWTIFVIRYLSSKRIYLILMKSISLLFLVSEVTLLFINAFIPIFFELDQNVNYHALLGREIIFYLQIFMYFLICIYSIIYVIKYKPKQFRRYVSISLFCMIMIGCIVAQVFEPLIPYYPIGCLIGVCMLNTYTLGETKEKFKNAYVETNEKFHKNEEKLEEALNLAYIDSLTKVKNKYAFFELEEKYDKLISNNEAQDFAVIVFDINGLKIINDTLGHDAGDRYIVDSVKVISDYFPFNDIYRFGGDEFVVVLTGNNYLNRQEYYDDFMKKIDDNLDSNNPIIASGMSKFKKETDNSFRNVFSRADKIMYVRKESLKEHN